MDKKNLKLLLTGAIVILAVCLGLSLAMTLRAPQPQSADSTPAQDAVTTLGQDVDQTVPAGQTLPEASSGPAETKPAETSGNQIEPGPPPDAPTQPSETAATEAPTEESAEESTEGTLPPNMLPIG